MADHWNDYKIFYIPALIILFIVGGSAFWYFQTEAGARTMKTWKSSNTGGIERTIDVYDMNGKMIRQYEGKVDIQDTDYGNKVLFDLDGKRTVIYNATVIVQEK